LKFTYWSEERRGRDRHLAPVPPPETSVHCTPRVEQRERERERERERRE